MSESADEPPVGKTSAAEGTAGNAAPKSQGLRGVAQGLKTRGLVHPLIAMFIGPGISLIPRFGLWGPDNAWLTAALLSPLVFHQAATLYDGGQSLGSNTSKALRGVLLSTFLMLGPLLIRSMVGPWCEPIRMSAFVLMGPVSSAVLASIMGTGLSSVLGKRTAKWLGILIPLLTYVLTLLRFYDTPAIFFYGHFFGYFPGTLYDASAQIESPYWWLRGSGLLVGLALYSTLFARGTWLKSQGRKPRLVLLVGPLLMWSAAISIELQSPEVGTGTTASHIEDTLGRTLRGRHCNVVVPEELPLSRAQRLLGECDFQVAEIRTRLGLGHGHRITAFFFRTTTEKRQLMGASDTYIAKPWRHEVYLQLERFPHPVLPHELVHAVAAEIGRGPFRISGSWGGLLPHTTIIEGLAVALSLEQRDGGIPHDWVRALRALQMLPTLEQTLGAGFLSMNTSAAYLISGSFIRWLWETRGPARIRRLYQTASFETAYQEPLRTLERDWLSFIDAQPEATEFTERARVRFTAPSVFAEICPHLRESTAAEIQTASAARDFQAALRVCAGLLREVGSDDALLTELVSLYALSGRLAEAERVTAQLAQRPAPPALLAAAYDRIADGYIRRAEWSDALRYLNQSAALPSSVDEQRQRELKIWSIENRAYAIPQILTDLERDPTLSVAASVLDETLTPSLARYLLARQAAAREDFELSCQLTLAVTPNELPTVLLRQEHARMIGSNCAETRPEVATAQLLLTLDSAETTAAERDESQVWLRRIEFRGSH